MILALLLAAAATNLSRLSCIIAFCHLSTSVVYFLVSWVLRCTPRYLKSSTTSMCPWMWLHQVSFNHFFPSLVLAKL